MRETLVRFIGEHGNACFSSFMFGFFATFGSASLGLSLPFVRSIFPAASVVSFNPAGEAFVIGLIDGIAISATFLLLVRAARCMAAGRIAKPEASRLFASVCGFALGVLAGVFILSFF